MPRLLGPVRHGLFAPRFGRPVGLWVGSGGAPNPGIYGAAIANDGLDNWRVGSDYGGWGIHGCATIFKAEQSSTITDLMWYLIGVTEDGYAAGTGGKVVIELYAVDGSYLPTGAALASTTEQTAGTNTGYKTSNFASPYSVTAGTYYALVWTNTDADPVTNYYSTDNLLDWNNTPPVNPRFEDDANAWRFIAKRANVSGGAWVDTTRTPILDITYGNAEHQGQGYLEVWGLGGSDGTNIADGTNRVRELFTPTSNLTVSHVGLRLCKTTGGTSALSVRLEQSDGTEIETVSIAAASIPDYSGSIRNGNAWIETAFASNRSLTSGQTYHIECSTSAGTTYHFEASAHGTGSYDAATYFDEGRMQKYNGSAWSNVLNGSGVASADADLQFYLRAV